MSSESFNRISSNIIFALQVLLIFLLMVENRVEIPTWLQPVGRMHPLLLHLPIGFLVALAALSHLKLGIDDPPWQKVRGVLLHLTVLVTVTTALMGFFLAREEGYDPETILWHKWTGVTFNFLSYCLLIIYQYGWQYKKIYTTLLWITVALMIVAGHLGAQLTHGMDFIFAPIQEEDPVITSETPVYEALIKPILKKKCYNCHNERKAKGELVMTAEEQLVTGGEHGPIWMAGNADSSRIMQYLLLPLDNEKHMPPKGKSQPTINEIQLIHHWISSGSDFKKRLADYADQEAVFERFDEAIGEVGAKDLNQYDFNFAAIETIKKLNTPFRSVNQLAIDLPALEASIFVRETYESIFLEELLEVEDQLISLNLTNLPIKDEDLSVIARFINLEKLRLNGTDITGAKLGELAACKRLRSIAVANTAVTKEIAVAIKLMPSLEEVYIWNSKISDDDLAALRMAFPSIYFDGGFVPEKGEKLKLSPPILKNQKLILERKEMVALASNYAGVEIRYTVDGSEPDSVHANIYDQPLYMDDQMFVKAKAYKDGWESSDVADFMLFRAGLRASSAALLRPSDRQFAGSGAQGLIDFEKGNARELFSPYWLGYKENPMEALIFFDRATEIKKVILSYCLNLDGARLPPSAVQIWGGNDESHLQMLASSKPPLSSDDESDRVDFYSMDLAGLPFSCYKLVVHPYSEVPKWHKRAGEKAFIMIDEILFY